MQYELLTVGIADHIATITIDRPNALNALNAPLLTELSIAIADLEGHDEVGIVVLTGAGKAFVAGADIAEMQGMDSCDAAAFAEYGGNVGRAIEESDKAYIAAVNGFALGGGCELALACDFIYASAKAKLGQPEVKLGVIPGFGGTQRLARRVGIATAKELIFTGDIIGAEEALRIGLVDKVVELDALMDTAYAIATKILANGPLAVAAAKRTINEGLSMTLEQGNRLEQLAFANLFSTDDQSEGMAAFLEKREPAFRGS